MSLTTALLYMQTLAAGIAGIQEAPAYPPESFNQFPIVVSFVTAGELVQESSGFGFALDTICTEIHGVRAVLPKDVAAMLSYGDLFFAKIIADPTLGGNVSTIEGNPTRAFGHMTWGAPPTGQITLGWRFEVRVKTLLTGV